MPAVSDTSPIFNLASIDRLNLLHQQFDEIWIPAAVESELTQVPQPSARAVIAQARETGWLTTRHASNKSLVSLLAVELHAGEAEAIALALDTRADHLLIDERDGRKMARQLGVPVIGVLGVLLRAKRMRQLRAIKPEIDALRANARFFLSDAMEKDVLAKAGE